MSSSPLHRQLLSRGDGLLFISRDAAQARYAERLSRGLVLRGFRCWDSPLADPENGLLDEQSLGALEAATAFVLLVSAEAAQSEVLEREAIVAAQLAKPVVAVRLTEGDPGTLAPFLLRATWVDGGSEDAVAAEIAGRFGPQIVPAPVTAPPPEPPVDHYEEVVVVDEPRRRSGWIAWVVLLVSAIAVAALVWTVVRGSDGPEDDRANRASRSRTNVVNTAAPLDLPQPINVTEPAINTMTPPPFVRNGAADIPTINTVVPPVPDTDEPEDEVAPRPAQPDTRAQLRQDLVQGCQLGFQNRAPNTPVAIVSRYCACAADRSLGNRSLEEIVANPLPSPEDLAACIRDATR